MGSILLKRLLSFNPVVLLSIVIVALILVGGIILFAPKNEKITDSNNNSNNVVPKILYDTSAPDPSKGSVETKSEIAGYEIAITSPKQLVDLLTSWGVFNHSFDLVGNGKNTGAVDNIIFILTNKPQKLRAITYDNNAAQASTDIFAIKNQLESRIYFSTNGLKNANSYITEQALFGLYLLSHPTKKGTTQAQIDEKYIKEISEAQVKGPLFVVIKTK